MAIKTVTVDTNKDIVDPKDGLTSLREALKMVNNQFQPARTWSINFDAPGDKKDNYWTLELKKPLPPILQGKVTLNKLQPKNITLLPSKATEENPFWDEKNSPPYNSLLTVGDAYTLYPDLRTLSYPKPTVILNNINFARNTSKGGNGLVGGGGGLGAGGGVCLVAGELTIKNSVFQNIHTVGGLGSRGASGGKGSYWKQVKTGWSSAPTKETLVAGEKGSGGGRGGYPGGFYGNSQVGDFSWDFGRWPWSFLDASNVPTLQGGAGGSGSETNVVNNRVDDYKDWPGLLKKSNGSPGRNGEASEFGIGGAGGGGGGGGSFSKYSNCVFGLEISGCRNFPNTDGKGGNGGNGGAGGFGAGGGAGGGAGQNSRGFGSAVAGGKGGSSTGTKSVGKGEDGQAAPAGSGLSNARPLQGTQYLGGIGGNGAALGGAIAVLSPTAKLRLYSVDFIDVDATAGDGAAKYNVLFSRDGSDVGGDNVNIYQSFESFDAEKPEYSAGIINNNDFYGTFKKIEDPFIRPNIIQKATSFVRNPQLARIRNSTITHLPGNPETTTLRYERPDSTGIRHINIDTSKLEESINDIYRRIIPVEDESQVYSRFNKKLLQGIVASGISTFTGISGADSLFKAQERTYDVAGAKKISYLAGAIPFLKSIMTAGWDLNNELVQNRKNIEELKKVTSIDRKSTSQSINIRSERTLITVKNFTLGEDILILEDFGEKSAKGIGPQFTAGIRAGQNTIDTIHISIPNVDSNSNTSTRIATIELDADSQKTLNAGKISSPIGYLQRLFSFDKTTNNWILGTVIDLDSVADRYVGGPAAEIIQINRPAGTDYSDLWSTTTYSNDDVIYGSEGNEKINTNGGNDRIHPGLGNDKINGGAGVDWINYFDIGRAINAIGSSEKNLNQDDDLSQINISLTNSENGAVLDSKIQEVEAITAFGNSIFDLSNLPKPTEISGPSSEFVQTNLNPYPGFYAVRTGSGSNIKGSKFKDFLIISMDRNSNIPYFLESSSVNASDQSSVSIEVNNLEGVAYYRPNLLSGNLKGNPVSSNQESASTVYKYMLLQPTIIDGGDSSDRLLFDFGKQLNSDDNSITNPPALLIGDVVNSPEYTSHKAVIYNDIVIALVRNVEIVQTFDYTTEAEYKSSYNGLSLILYDPHNNTKDQYAYNNYSSMVDTTNSVEGTTYNDKILGTNSADKITGNSGPDHLAGKGNSDFLHGGSGNDRIYGGNGKDVLIGGNGDDDLLGNRGKDLLDGGDGNDELTGGNGKDVLIGGDGDDVIFGGSGDDRLEGGKGNNSLYGGTGNDIFVIQKGAIQTIYEFNSYSDSLFVNVDNIERDDFDIKGNSIYIENELVARFK